jgi:acyl carrier protein
MQITQIWEEFLPSPVGVTDNFFEQGGHSFMAMRLISRIRSVFGRDLPLESFVGKGTVEHLAHLLDGQPESGSRPAITQALMET